MLFADEALARLLIDQRRLLARSVAHAAEQILPEAGPWIYERDGVVASFAGDGSPVTQAVGLSDDSHLAGVAEFFQGRTSRWEAILTPFSGTEIPNRLRDLGARVEQFENVLYRELGSLEGLPEPPRELEIVEVRSNLLPTWTEVAVRGFFGDLRNSMTEQLGGIMSRMPNTWRYLALWNGEAVGAATLFVGEGVVALGGMATLPEFRGRGIQGALIAHRLSVARELAPVAAVETMPGTGSQRNAERFGFQLAYTQTTYVIEDEVDE